MYSQIKAAAEAAIKLQNKNEMEAALKWIIGACDYEKRSELADAESMKMTGLGDALREKLQAKAVASGDPDASVSAEIGLPGAADAEVAADRLKALTGVDLTAKHARETVAAKVSKKGFFK